MWRVIPKVKVIHNSLKGSKPGFYIFFTSRALTGKWFKNFYKLTKKIKKIKDKLAVYQFNLSTTRSLLNNLPIYIIDTSNS